MKKLLALLLAVAMLSCLAMSVSAANFNTDAFTTGGDALVSKQTIQVNLNKDSATNVVYSDPVYSVDVVWGAATFTYELSEHVTATMVWNPSTHTYDLQSSTVADGEQAGQWSADSFVKATVTNHSNAEVKATLTLPATTNNVEFTVDGGETEKTLASADVGESLHNYDAAPEVEFVVRPANDNLPTGSFSVETKITLSKVTPAP